MSETGWGNENLVKISSIGYPVHLLMDLSDLHRACIGQALDASKTLAVSSRAHQPGSQPPILSDLEESEEFLSLADDVGFLTIRFDALTRRRSEVVANFTVAHLHGIHREEYLARMARRELSLPFTQLDGLLVAFYMVVRDAFAGGAPAQMYCRMASGRGAARRGLLFCSRSVVQVDGAGRLCEVSRRRRRRWRR